MKKRLNEVMAIIHEAANEMEPTRFCELLELIQWEIDKILDGDIEDYIEPEENNNPKTI